MGSKGKFERGLEELRLNLMMDIEPIDPPVGLRDKIMSITEKKPKKFSFLTHWPKVAVAACILLLGLWGFSLYQINQINQLKDKPNAQYVNPLEELGTSLGEVQKEMPLVSYQSNLNGKAYVLHGQDGSKLIVTSEGLRKKKETNVLQVWVEESGIIKSVGAIEPVDGKVFFSSVIKNADAIFITEEDSYKLAPEGEILLSSEENLNPNLIASNEDKPEDKQDNGKNNIESTNPVTNQPSQQDGIRDNKGDNKGDKNEQKTPEGGDDKNGGKDNSSDKEDKKPNNPSPSEDNQNRGNDGVKDKENDKDYMVTANIELGNLLDVKVELIDKDKLTGLNLTPQWKH